MDGVLTDGRCSSRLRCFRVQKKPHRCGVVVAQTSPVELLESPGRSGQSVSESNSAGKPSVVRSKAKSATRRTRKLEVSAKMETGERFPSTRQSKRLTRKGTLAHALLQQYRPDVHRQPWQEENVILYVPGSVSYLASCRRRRHCQEAPR